MARMAGAVSNANITLPQLLKVVGSNYKGKIVVGTKWLRAVTEGTETFDVRLISRKKK